MTTTTHGCVVATGFDRNGAFVRFEDGHVARFESLAAAEAHAREADAEALDYATLMRSL